MSKVEDGDVEMGTPKFVEGDYDIDMSQPKLEDAAPDSCGTRCCAEWGSSYPGWFSIEEGQKTLDIPASFGPTALWARLVKFCTMGTTCGILIWSWVESRDEPAFFLAYLTYWSLIFACFWLITSFINSLVPPKQPEKFSDTVSLWVKFSWIMFEVAAHFTLIVTVLYWALDYEPGETTITFRNVFIHGIHMVLVWTDGLLINRMPVRWKHLPLLMFLASCYIIWLVIHQLVTDIGNPNTSDNDPDTNDDLIYTAVNFTDSTAFSIALVLAVIFVFVPLIHWLLWGLSLGCPCSCSGSNRRYVSVNSDSHKDGRGATDNDGSNNNVNVY